MVRITGKGKTRGILPDHAWHPRFIHLEAWRLKVVAVYRDGCKRSQSLAAGG